MRHHVRVRLDPLQEAEILQPADDLLARDKPVDARAIPPQAAPILPAVRADNPRCRQATSAPSWSSTLICGRLCRRPTSKSLKSCAGVTLTAPEPFSGSEYSSATIGILPSDQRQDDVLADQIRVALVVRIHRDRAVAEHRLRARGGDDDEGRGILRIEGLAFQRIAQIPEAALDLDLLHLEIGNRGQQLRIPVHQPLVLVDQPFTMQFDEHLRPPRATGLRPW